MNSPLSTNHWSSLLNKSTGVTSWTYLVLITTTPVKWPVLPVWGVTDELQVFDTEVQPLVPNCMIMVQGLLLHSTLCRSYSFLMSFTWSFLWFYNNLPATSILHAFPSLANIVQRLFGSSSLPPASSLQQEKNNPIGYCPVQFPGPVRIDF